MYGEDINYSVSLFDFALGHEKTKKPLHHYLPTFLAHGLQSVSSGSEGAPAASLTLWDLLGAKQTRTTAACY